MKNLLLAIAIAVVLCFVSSAEAQRRGGQRGGGPPGGGPPPRGLNQENFNNNQNQQQFGNQAARNQNGDQAMPTIQQLAQMMIANFDADGSGELGHAELQSALEALRQMMQNRAAAQGNRPPPPRGQGNARRGR